MREQTTVNVRITSPTITAEQLTTKLNLKAARSWKAGAARGTFGAIEREHGFELESALGPQSSVEQHLGAMIDRLKACAQTLGGLAKEVTVQITLSLTRRRAPILHFDRDTLRWIAVMGGKLDIDTQVIPEEPPPKQGGAAGAGGAAGGSGGTGSF